MSEGDNLEGLESDDFERRRDNESEDDIQLSAARRLEDIPDLTDEDIAEIKREREEGRKCKSCGKLALYSAMFCTHCGNKLDSLISSLTMDDIPDLTDGDIERLKDGEKCKSCGEMGLIDESFCPHCGIKINI